MPPQTSTERDAQLLDFLESRRAARAEPVALTPPGIVAPKARPGPLGATRPKPERPDRDAQLLDFLERRKQSLLASPEYAEGLAAREPHQQMDPVRKAAALRRVDARAEGQLFSSLDPEVNRRADAWAKRTADTITIGHGDEYVGMMEGGIPSMLSDVAGMDFAGSLDRATAAYRRARDDSADEAAALAEDHPISAGSGTATGLALTLGPRRVLSAAQAIPRAYRSSGAVLKGLRSSPSGIFDAVLHAPDTVVAAVRNMLTPSALAAGARTAVGGAAAGAAAGSGYSDADLTQGETNEYLDDVGKAAGVTGAVTGVLGAGARSLQVTADDIANLLPGQIWGRRIGQMAGATAGYQMAGEYGAGIGLEVGRQLADAIFRKLRPFLAGKLGHNPAAQAEMLAAYEHLYRSVADLGPMAVAQLHGKLMEGDETYREAMGGSGPVAQLPRDRHPSPMGEPAQPIEVAEDPSQENEREALEWAASQPRTRRAGF